MAFIARTLRLIFLLTKVALKPKHRFGLRLLTRLPLTEDEEAGRS